MRRTLLFLALVTVSVAQDKLILSDAPPPLPKKQPPKSSCAVQELYVIAWSTHDPIERHKAMLGWLDKSKCSVDDYTLIWNNLPEW
ncbi:MAG: hypothetical protein WCP79_11685, partial [Bacillota bacterium]